MTAHISPLQPSAPAAKPGMATASLPYAPFQSSIIALHVGGAFDDDHDGRALHDQAVALDRLGAYLADEGPSLERVLRLFGLVSGQADLAALLELHVEPHHETEALREAAVRLERLLEDLAQTPNRADVFGLVPPAELSVMRELDAGIRWLGARTQDILSVVERALA